MQLRAIDRSVALRILEMLTRFGESGVGDVSPLRAENGRAASDCAVAIIV